MNRRLHPTTTFFTITTLLATAILSQETDQPYYDTCSQSVKCGNLILDYPFWGFGRPEYCGHPRFQLTCQSDVPIIVFESVSYRVIDTDTTTHTITIARDDLWDNICPTSLHNTSYDTTLFIGNNSDQEDVSLFYRCRDNLPGPGDEPLNTSFRFSCGRDSYGYFYRTDLIPVDTVNLLVECDDGIVVPVNRSSADRLASVTATEGDLRSALKSGFSLEWKANNEECDRCVRSDGKCGSNSTSPELFACYEGAGGNSKSRPSHIVFAIVGSAIVVVCIGCGIFVWIRLRKRRAIKEAPYTQTKSRAIFTTGSSHGLTSDNSTFTASSISSFPSSKTSDTFIDIGKSTYFGAQVFTYEELELATNNFNDSRELGDGGFGTVYFGKLLDGREVAVKRLYENNFRRVEQFINEVRILTGLHHENLVKLHGCTSKRSRELLLVYEYIPNGTVADHLHGKLANPSSSLLSWPVRLNIAIQTAEALAYLHKSAVIHRDVKTNNILLDKSFQVKVADFGLSRLFENVTHVSTAPQGTPGYVDPEYYQCYQLTDKSDVYSFGVVLIELISSLQAVDISRNRHDINLSNMAVSMIQSRQLDELVDKSVGFERDGSVRKNVTLVAELAFRCLQQEKDLRPTMQEVMDNLREIQNDELNDQKPEVVDIVVDYGDLLKGHNSESTSANSGVN